MGNPLEGDSWRTEADFQSQSCQMNCLNVAEHLGSVRNHSNSDMICYAGRLDYRRQSNQWVLKSRLAESALVPDWQMCLEPGTVVAGRVADQKYHMPSEQADRTEQTDRHMPLFVVER